MKSVLDTINTMQKQYDELCEKHDNFMNTLKKAICSVEQEIVTLDERKVSTINSIKTKYELDIESEEQAYSKDKAKFRSDFDADSDKIIKDTEARIDLLKKSIKNAQDKNSAEELELVDEINHYKGNITSDKKSIINKEIKLLKSKFDPSVQTELYSSNPEKELCQIKDDFFKTLFALKVTTKKLEDLREANISSADASLLMKIKDVELEKEKALAQTKIIFNKKKEERKNKHDRIIAELNKNMENALLACNKEIEEQKGSLEKKLKQLNLEVKETENNQNLALSEFLRSAKEQLDEFFVEPDYHICKDPDFTKLTDIPESFSIGCIPQNTQESTLLKVLYGKSIMQTFTSIDIGVREGNNVIIKAKPSSMSDDLLYKIICGIVLKNLEVFPLGSLSLTLIDTLNDKSLATISRSFQQAASEKGKLVVKSGLIDTIDNAIGSFNSISQSVKYIFNKLSDDACSDLYSLFKRDNTEMFNLIVIRNGFKDIANRTEILNQLVSFTKRKECGVRFVIVDDIDALKETDDQKTLFIKQLEDVSIVIKYDNDSFVYDDKVVNLSHITNEEWVHCLENETKQMAQFLDANANKVTTYEELGFGKLFEKADDAIEIPIGLSAGKPYNVVFGCGGPKANIGCMVLGRVRSGKSSVFHSVVINGAMKYSPEDLQFWLLDFKSGAASSFYIDANIPHISIVAANNTTEDAFSLLKMLSSELESRQRLYNSLGVSDISQYNKYIEKNPHCGHKRMPRILVVIDEAQDLIPQNAFDDSSDYTNNIKALLIDIANKCGNRGVHIVMCAQNFQNGKSYELIDGFMGQAKTRISFNIEPGFADSLGNSFKNNQTEIASLPRLTAMGSSEGGIEALTKFVVAVSNGKDNFAPYFRAIREKYKDQTNKFSTAIIGGISQLKPSSKVHNQENTYVELIEQTSMSKAINNFDLIFGEDYYSLNPMSFRFNDENISGCVVVGSNSSIGSSILLSIMYGSINSGFECYVYDGMARKNIFKSAIFRCKDIKRYNDIFSLLFAAQSEMLARKQQLKIDPDKEFTPLMLLLNNICSSQVDELNQTFEEFNTERIKENRNNYSETSEGVMVPNSDIDDNDDINDITALSLLKNLINQGHEVGVYVNLSIPNANYEYQDILDSSNIIASYAVKPIDGLNSNDLYRVKLHLETISKLTYPAGHPKAMQVLEPSDHPFAVFIRNSQAYRVRPIMWDIEDIKCFGEENEKIICKY